MFELGREGLFELALGRGGVAFEQGAEHLRAHRHRPRRPLVVVDRLLDLAASQVAVAADFAGEVVEDPIQARHHRRPPPRQHRGVVEHLIEVGDRVARFGREALRGVDRSRQPGPVAGLGTRHLRGQDVGEVGRRLAQAQLFELGLYLLQVALQHLRRPRHRPGRRDAALSATVLGRGHQPSSAAGIFERVLQLRGSGLVFAVAALLELFEVVERLRARPFAQRLRPGGNGQVAAFRRRALRDLPATFELLERLQLLDLRGQQAAGLAFGEQLQRLGRHHFLGFEEGRLPRSARIGLTS